MDSPPAKTHTTLGRRGDVKILNGLWVGQILVMPMKAFKQPHEKVAAPPTRDLAKYFTQAQILQIIFKGDLHSLLCCIPTEVPPISHALVSALHTKVFLAKGILYSCEHLVTLPQIRKGYGFKVLPLTLWSLSPTLLVRRARKPCKVLIYSSPCPTHTLDAAVATHTNCYGEGCKLLALAVSILWRISSW